MIDLLGLVDDEDMIEDEYQQTPYGSMPNSYNENMFSQNSGFGSTFQSTSSNGMNVQNQKAQMQSMEPEQQSFNYNRATFKGSPKVMNFNNTSEQIKMIVIKPDNYDEAREICDYIKGKKPVVVNLENMDYEIAQRVMDFLSGSCYSLNGSVQRVAKNIFIVAPDNIDVTSDFKSEMKGKSNSLSWMNSFNKNNSTQQAVGQQQYQVSSMGFRQ